MDWITLDTLKSVGGASLAVTVVTAAVKSLFPSIRGRRTQFVALGLSLSIAAVIGRWSTLQGGMVTILNGFVIFSAAVGLDQAVNYQSRRKPSGEAGETG